MSSWIMTHHNYEKLQDCIHHNDDTQPWSVEEHGSVFWKRRFSSVSQDCISQNSVYKGYCIVDRGSVIELKQRRKQPGEGDDFFLYIGGQRHGLSSATKCKHSVTTAPKSVLSQLNLVLSMMTRLSPPAHLHQTLTHELTKERTFPRGFHHHRPQLQLIHLSSTHTPCTLRASTQLRHFGSRMSADVAGRRASAQAATHQISNTRLHLTRPRRPPKRQQQIKFHADSIYRRMSNAAADETAYGVKNLMEKRAYHKDAYIMNLLMNTGRADHRSRGLPQQCPLQGRLILPLPEDFHLNTRLREGHPAIAQRFPHQHPLQGRVIMPLRKKESHPNTRFRGGSS